MSDIVLSGKTALNCYMSIRAWKDELSPKIFRKDSRVPDEKEIQEIKNSERLCNSSIEVLLYDPRKQNQKSEAIQSYFSTTRHGVVVQAISNDPFFPDDKYLIVSPAFLLAQLASKWDFYQLYSLALEFAGTYSVNDQNDGFLQDVAPIVSKKSLNGMVKKLSKARWPGIANLRNTAKYLGENSASPMESELFAKLSLPTYLGGYGIRGLKMNVEIHLSSTAIKIAGRSNLKVDILHEASRVVVEYDSRQFHSDYGQSQIDKRRRDALQNDGYKCFSIVTEQISNREVFNACIKPIVAEIKGRCRIRNKNFDFNQQQLFRYFRLLKIDQ